MSTAIGHRVISRAKLLARSTHPLAPQPFADLDCLLWRLHEIHALLLRRGFSDAVTSRAVEEVLHVGQKALKTSKAAAMSPEQRAGWLWVVALNAAKRAAAAEVVRVPLNFDPSDCHLSSSDEEPPLFAAIREVVDRLPERQRQAVVLHVLQGMSFREAGREMGVRASTVVHHFRAARAGLAHVLSKLVPGFMLGKKGVASRTRAPLS